MVSPPVFPGVARAGGVLAKPNRGMDLSLPPRKPHRQSRYTIWLQTGGKRLRLTSRPAK